VAGDTATIAIHGIEDSVVQYDVYVCVADLFQDLEISFARRMTRSLSALHSRRVSSHSKRQGPSCKDHQYVPFSYLLLTKVVIHRGRIDEPARIKQIVSLVDKADGHVIKKKPR